jgi:PAS domain-containing protein
VAHVELSLTESFIPHALPDQEPLLVDGDTGGTLQRWSAVVRKAAEPSLVIDARETIVGASAACCELLGLGDPVAAAGRTLLDEVRLIDFTANRGELTEPEMANIPPLLAVTSGRLARGLLRVQRLGQLPSTVDAISTPLCEGDEVVGSLTFFAEV